MPTRMNGYIAFYLGKKIEVHAETSYAAFQQAVEKFKPPKSKQHHVVVQLAEIDGKQHTISTEGL